MNSTTLSLEEIMTRITALHRSAAIHFRPKYPAMITWSADPGPVVMGSLSAGGWCSFFGNGTTPEGAVRNLWDQVLLESAEPSRFFLIFNSLPNEKIPGDEPQVWVRWNSRNNEWEDVLPTPEALALRGIPADRIRAFAEHHRIQNAL